MKLSHPRLKTLSQSMARGKAPFSWTSLYASQTLFDALCAKLSAEDLAQLNAEPELERAVLVLLLLCCHSAGQGEACLNLAGGWVAPEMHTESNAELREASAEELQEAQEPKQKARQEASENKLPLNLPDKALSQRAVELMLCTGLAVQPGQESQLPAIGASPSGLILDNEILYLRRVWQEWSSIEQWRKNAAFTASGAPAQETLTGAFTRLFPNAREENGQANWQAVAAAQALSQTLTLISGGPGTGKTSTAARILVLLVLQAITLEEEPAFKVPRIRLLAPTGKAALRLRDAIESQLPALLERLALDASWRAAITQALPKQGETIHRALLEATPHGRYRSFESGQSFAFLSSDELLLRADDRAKLRADIVLIDEASMIDQTLMHKMLGAFEADKVIMMGDHYQLPPVEAGEVFSRWVRTLDGCPYHEQQLRNIEAHTGLSQDDFPGVLLPSSGTALKHEARVLCQLSKTYRFSGPIYDFAQALRGQVDGAANSCVEALMPVETAYGRASSVQDLLDQPALEWVNLDESHTDARREALNQRVLTSLAPYAEYFALVKANAPARALFEAQSKFQLMSSCYEGPLGVDHLNRLVEQRLGQRTGLYHGKLIMMSRNQPDLGLANGDLGIIVQAEVAASEFDVVFHASQGETLRLPLSQVKEWKTAFAISVHKSQGSEYDRVSIFVPEYASELVSRRLIYTAITRAKVEAECWMSGERLRALLAGA